MLLFGAGKIGRSFIGQLFSLGGWEVVFADVIKPLIDELNLKGRYRIIIKEEVESVIWVENVRGVWAMDTEAITRELCSADLAAVSVGLNGLPAIMPLIAGGLRERYRSFPDKSLDIIIAENLRNAAHYFEGELTRLLPPEYPFHRLVGLVETSIGKMVPIMQEKDLREDALQVFAEAYNTLILDKKGFKNPVPAIKGLAPKENMKAWVDRKLFIHNLGHAAAAYLGYGYNPAFRYIYEVLEVPRLYEKIRQVMLQSAEALFRKYPGEFTLDSLTVHIDDLLKRFRNHALGDTIFRVGCDLTRKLSPHDRLVGAIRLAEEMDVPFDLILETLVSACHFRANDENGKMFPADIVFAETCRKGIHQVLTGICGFNRVGDQQLIIQAEDLEKYLNQV
jgi:mannitol-1-phosphate 5-dehydrogenase